MPACQSHCSIYVGLSIIMSVYLWHEACFEVCKDKLALPACCILYIRTCVHAPIVLGGPPSLCWTSSHLAQHWGLLSSATVSNCRSGGRSKLESFQH